MVRPAGLSESELAALDEAQLIVFDAWETPVAAKRAALARKALALSPHCADAWSILAEAAPAGSAEELELRQRAVAAGETAIGPSLDEMSGELWGWTETRPYMRALHWLATAHEVRGAIEDALATYRRMIDLNPNDNQGIRYVLASLLAGTGRHDELAALVDRYPDEGGAMWLWPLALAAFARHGDGPESRAALDAAVASNGHVAALLTGRKKMPKTLPDYYSPGDTGEAFLYVDESRKGWRAIDGALEWLAARVPAAPAPLSRRSRRAN